MDHRELLKKYIHHVAEREGPTFLESGGSFTLSEDDRAELRIISAESTEDKKFHTWKRD